MMSIAKEYGCSASVTFTIRVTGSGHWGKEATVEEVMRQGGHETINAVKNALNTGGLRYEMIGEPLVGAITWGPTR
jgi:hypothetical protein